MPEPNANAFDPETIAVMRNAFEQAWSSMTPQQQACISQSALALEILKFARQGENDAQRLCTRALMSIAPHTTRFGDEAIQR
jgi:hypothetical protein